MDAVNQRTIIITENYQSYFQQKYRWKIIEDYNAFVILTKLEYRSGLIKEESTSELLRFTIRHMLSQVHNQPEYLVLNKSNNTRNKFKIISNKSFIVKFFYSRTTTAYHQSQVPNISRTNNTASQK